MFLVQDDSRWFALGLVLLGLGSIFFELASVSYNALLVGVSTPATIGRVSGFGWAMGYLGGIVLLLAVYLGFIAGDGGLLGVPTENGLNIRVVALVAAGWFAVFALPLLLLGARAARRPDRRRPGSGVAAAPTARCSPTCARSTGGPRTPCTSWPPARCTGTALAAIFAFGAVLAVTVYGIDAADVLIFGVAANVTAAAGRAGRPGGSTTGSARRR